jgi:hypothetical protein
VTDYAYDLFVSYPRRAPIGDWVNDRFVPLLEKWLGAALPHAPRIFIDRAMESGTHWPSNLAESLLRSKHMLAVWAPPYFGSGWCMSEWQSMKLREQRLGLAAGMASGLVRAIRFFDGETFPADAKAIQADDYTPFNMFPPGKARLNNARFNRFEQAVQQLSLELANRIMASPPWDPTWPTMQSPSPQFDTSLPFEKIGLGR